MVPVIGSYPVLRFFRDVLAAGRVDRRLVGVTSAKRVFSRSINVNFGRRTAKSEDRWCIGVISVDGKKAKVFDLSFLRLGIVMSYYKETYISAKVVIIRKATCQNLRTVGRSLTDVDA